VFRNRRTAVIALSTVPILGFAFGTFLAVTLPGRANPDKGTEAFGTGANPVTSTSLTPSPTASPTPIPTSASPTSPRTPPRTTRPRDATAPTIGTAVTEVSQIWTDFWCSAGPTRTNIQIPVRDPTDPARALKVNVRFVLHREDKGTFDLDEVNVQSDKSPFAFQLGPYPGPNPAYTYSNVLDMVVTATDRTGNKTVRTFASFMTFMDCKA
jgi:hypothetical protein